MPSDHPAAAAYTARPTDLEALAAALALVDEVCRTMAARWCACWSAAGPPEHRRRHVRRVKTAPTSKPR